MELAGRISGDTAVGLSLAYCLAVEDATATSVPHEAQVLRGALLELERLYNHIADIGALCNDVGFGVAHALRIRARLLRLNAQTTGHRLLRGGVIPRRRSRARATRSSHARTRQYCVRCNGAAPVRPVGREARLVASIV